MKKEKIVVASANNGKIKEIKSVFYDFDIYSLLEMNYSKDIEEDQNTFEDNALKKAAVISNDLDILCIADDSGICIEALDGFPGVKTARWLKGSDRDRNMAIIEKMKDLPKEQRKVTFNVSIAIVNKNMTFVTTETLDGYISSEPRGNNGFGFDEIFELENGKTLAELSFEEKESIGCRRKALEKAKEYISNLN